MGRCVQGRRKAKTHQGSCSWDGSHKTHLCFANTCFCSYEELCFGWTTDRLLKLDLNFPSKTYTGSAKIHFRKSQNTGLNGIGVVHSVSTWILRRKWADSIDSWIFSGRENWWRIPPTDKTVEALEYYMETEEIFNKTPRDNLYKMYCDIQNGNILASVSDLRQITGKDSGSRFSSNLHKKELDIYLKGKQ